MMQRTEYVLSIIELAERNAASARETAQQCAAHSETARQSATQSGVLDSSGTFFGEFPAENGFPDDAVTQSIESLSNAVDAQLLSDAVNSQAHQTLRLGALATSFCNGGDQVFIQRIKDAERVAREAIATARGALDTLAPVLNSVPPKFGRANALTLAGAASGPWPEDHQFVTDWAMGRPLNCS